jgi:hypothetical protein
MDRLRCTEFIGLWLIIVLGAASASALESDAVPAELERWRTWVLHGQAEALCPAQYNEGTILRCRWPARLELEVTAEGGRFEQRWLIFARGWVALPGDSESWPDAVSVNGNSVAVLDRGGVPMIELPPGEHRVMGRFFWYRRPEVIAIPPELGLLSLTLDGRNIPLPVIDAEGRVWLQKSTGAAHIQDHLEPRIFRLINDTIPMQITTILRLSVSGAGREAVFENLLPETSVPMALSSRLPVRLDAQGHLRVQARAGQWEVRIDARLPGPVRKLTAPCDYGEEIWSFQPQHFLRMVEIGGVPAIAPSQTEMPIEWHAWPAYLVKADNAVEFKEIRRGDPDPPPDRLSLHRRLWLDFDGGGFTVHDRIDGTLSRSWHLGVNAPMELGRVDVDGENRVITQSGDAKQAGVALRQGRLALSADSRFTNTGGAIAAVGWNHDFEQVDGVLHLPPGWRLLTAAGVDQVSDTWIQRWSLLDLFLVLIIALAVFELRGWRWGVIALAAMVLIFHEPGAPRLVWLHILAVLALLPRLPAGWVKKGVALWGMGAAIVLLVTTIPFAVQQLRWGIYPQLGPADEMASHRDDAQELVRSKMMPASPMRALTLPATEPRLLPDSTQWRYDPDALIPTGPGLPDWQWHTIALQWNGPVTAEQPLRLVLLSPTLNLLLAFVRVGLLAALLLGLADWRALLDRVRRLNAPAALLLFVILSAWGSGIPAVQAENVFPPPALLEEFRHRLLEKPDCLPDCANVSRLELTITNDMLQLVLKINAARRTAVPLPVDRGSWTPEQILLDNAPIAGLTRDSEGQLWAFIPQGLHTVVLSGAVDQEGVVQIPLPLRPHAAASNAPGWEVKGLQADGQAETSIHLTRLQQEGISQTATVALPGFMQVERRLRLGLSWQIETTVRRRTPPGTPIVADIPLLSGESITTAGITIDKGRALVHLAADQSTVTYTSDLAIAPSIMLNAPRGVPWTETWYLDAGPIWRCELEGIPVIHHQDPSGQWQPQWQPWPGESVTIRVTRPASRAGQHATIDSADLTWVPGMRSLKGALRVLIRTSQASQYTVQLPAHANLQAVTVDDLSLPVRQDGAFLTIPLHPGAQRVNIQWHQPVAFSALFKTPEVKIGAAAVNARVTLQMPAKRWILLTGGPRWGPAVLFWSYLTVIVLSALALGRLGLGPLKTWQWLLLGLGLTQIPPVFALIIVGWLLVMGVRERHTAPAHRLAFDGMQIGLVLWTLAALISLFTAVKAGLIGQPEMQIQGNDSDLWHLNWIQDHVAGGMPHVWVFSLPLWVFRTFMLAWSLWLAFRLLHWLQWSWTCFSREGLWRKLLSGRRPARAAQTAPGIDQSS